MRLPGLAALLLLLAREAVGQQPVTQPATATTAVAATETIEKPETFPFSSFEVGAVPWHGGWRGSHAMLACQGSPSEKLTHSLIRPTCCAQCDGIKSSSLEIRFRKSSLHEEKSVKFCSAKFRA